MRFLARFSTLAASMALAVAANAFQFGAISDGSYDSGTGIDNETVIGVTNIAPLDTLFLQFVGGGTGYGDYNSSDGYLYFTFTWGPPAAGYPFGDGNYYNGNWTYSNASDGQFGNLMGGGTFAFGINQFNGNTGYHSNTTLVGNLAAVPEPAACAALGIGSIGFLRRKKRA